MFVSFSAIFKPPPEVYTIYKPILSESFFIRPMPQYILDCCHIDIHTVGLVKSSHKVVAESSHILNLNTSHSFLSILCHPLFYRYSLVFQYNFLISPLW